MEPGLRKVNKIIKFQELHTVGARIVAHIFRPPPAMSASLWGLGQILVVLLL